MLLRITALSWWRGLWNSMKLWAHILQMVTQDRWIIMKSSEKNVVHWRREWQTTQVFLLGELHEQYEKAKRYDTGSPSGQKVSNILIGKSGGQLLIAPERMKHLGWSRNNTQLWMCLVVKVNLDVVKNNITQEPGTLYPWIKVNWKCQAEDGSSEH